MSSEPILSPIELKVVSVGTVAQAGVLKAYILKVEFCIFRRFFLECCRHDDAFRCQAFSQRDDRKRQLRSSQIEKVAFSPLFIAREANVTVEI